MPTSNRDLLAFFPWQETSLGPIADWPPEMQSVIRAIMQCGYPVSTLWGDDLIQIYNDAFNKVAGDNHPAAFGAPMRPSGSAVASPSPPNGADADTRQTRAVAHDFNNMLTVILGNLDVLEERLTDEADLKLVRSSVRAAEDAGVLTRQLLARPAGGPAPVDTTPPPPVIPGAASVRSDRNQTLEHGTQVQPVAGEQRYSTLVDFLPIAIWEEDISAAMDMLDGLRQAGVSDLGAWLGENPAFIDRALLSVRVVDANRAARSLHGVTGIDTEALTQALARNLSEPRFRDCVGRMLLGVWQGENTIRVNSTILQEDGSKTDLLVQMLIQPDSGRLLVTELDVTEQRRAEERFRHVAHASSDYIFDRDFETETTWVNDGASWHPDLPAGPSVVPRGAWVDSVHPDDNDRVLNGVDGAIRSGAGFWEGEYRLRLRDGDFIPVRERASILRNEAGAPVRMIGNIVDLSEQKALEAQLRQAQRLDAIGQLTGGIAHDFNNLLTVVLGNAEMLVDILARVPDKTALTDAKPEETARAAIMAQQIVSASERGSELTQRLLAFARKQPLAPGVHDAAALVEGMRMLVERSITPTITLEMDVAQSAGRVHVDRAMFESALLNLCLNARDAMPEGGHLRIEARTVPHAEGAGSGGISAEATDYVRIAVSDTGTGMDDETRVRVFEPFFTTKPPGEGNGLGLSMVYGFVRQSGGDVVIDSKPGVGTTVAMLLPAHARMPLDEDTPKAGPKALPSAFQGRVLVVEDHEQVRQYTCMLLRSLGFEVVDEPRAASALERLRAGEKFDLLLSDIIMPGEMGGRKLAETVLAEWPHLRVLLVSGYSDDITALNTPLAPHITFLRKPFRKGDLAERLAQMLAVP